MMDTRSAHGRLTLALVASLLVHAWAMHDARGLGRPRVEAGGAAALSAQLQPPMPAMALPTTHDVPVPPAQTSAATLPPVHAPAEVTPPRATSSAVESVTTQATPVAPNEAPLPQPADPTYYGALSLDVYPRAIIAPNLSELAGTAASGEVRATVLIDEAGVVNDVRDIVPADAQLARTVRTLLLQTPFTPARRDGRIVKAQVRVSLPYGKMH